MSTTANQSILRPKLGDTDKYVFEDGKPLSITERCLIRDKIPKAMLSLRTSGR